MDNSWRWNFLFGGHKSIDFGIKRILLLFGRFISLLFLFIFPFFSIFHFVIVSTITLSSLVLLLKQWIKEVIFFDNTSVPFLDNFVYGDWSTKFLGNDGISLLHIDKLLILEKFRDCGADLHRLSFIISHTVGQKVTDQMNKFLCIFRDVLNN